MSQLFNVEAEINKRQRALRRGQSQLVILGDGRGTADANLYADKQHVWARYPGEKTSSGYATLGAPFRVLAGVNYSPEINMAVWISWKRELGYYIERPDPVHLDQTGRSMHLLNPNAPQTKFIKQNQFLPLLSLPLSASSMKVNVGALLYSFVDDSGAWVYGQWHGSNASTHANLASAVPVAANQHRYALVYFDIDAHRALTPPIAITVSTPKADTVLLAEADVAECIAALPHPRCLPVKAYRVASGQTGMRGHHLDRDVRNFVNLPQAGSAPFPRTLTVPRTLTANTQLVVSTFSVDTGGLLTVVGLLTQVHGAVTLTGTGVIHLTGDGLLNMIA